MTVVKALAVAGMCMYALHDVHLAAFRDCLFSAAGVDELVTSIYFRCSLVCCCEQEADRITKDGYLLIKSDKTRLRMMNQADCLDRIRTMIFDAIDDKPKSELVERQAR